MTAKISKKTTKKCTGQARQITDFRQSGQYYDVVFETFAHTGVAILARGSDDDDASKTERAAKRRRIEDMATDFLRGKPLYICSARSSPMALEAYLGWNKRTSSEQNFDIRSIPRPEACDRIWDDVEDHDDILERLRENNANRSRLGNSSASSDHRVEEVTGRSACKRQAPAKAPKVSATLRRRAANAANPVPNKVSTILAHNAHSPGWRTLNRQSKSLAEQLEPHGVANHQGRCVVDSFEAVETAVKPAVIDFNQTEALQELETSASHDPIDDGQAPDKDPDSTRGIDHSYHTAPEPTEIPTVLLSRIPEILQAEDSQDRLLRQKGIQVKPRKSWAAMNELAGVVNKENTESTFDETEAHIEPTNSVRDMLLGSAYDHAGQRKSSRRRKNSSIDENQPTPNTNGTASGQTESQNAVDPDLPVDMQRRMGAFRPLYTTAAETQSGTTPMQYRPRHSDTAAIENTDAADASVKKQRRRVDFSSPRVGRNKTKKPGKDLSATTAPQLEISLGPASSFGPDLNLALGHGDHVEASAQRATLHMQASNHAPEPSKDSDVQLKVLQADTTPDARENQETDGHSFPSNPTAVAATESGSGKLGRLSHFWPGTQAALDQAELTLFNSPEKSVNEKDKEQTDDTPTFQRPGQASCTGKKPSLGRASPEKFPSTQQLIDGFGGFSTIKKPRTDRRKSVEPTPVRHGGALQSFNLEESWGFSNLVTPAHEFGKERSDSRCLRDEDLGQILQNQQESTASDTHRSSGQTAVGDDDSPSSAKDPARLKENATTTTGNVPSDTRHMRLFPDTLLADATTEVLSSDAPLPSHQCAQESQENVDNFAIAEELVRDVFGQSL